MGVCELDSSASGQGQLLALEKGVIIFLVP